MVGCQSPFFLPPDSAAQRGTAAAKGCRWGDVYTELTAAGFGSPEQLGRYTEQQLRLYHERLMRQRAHRRAALIEDFAMAYSGCKTKDGIREMQRRIDELMRD